VAVVRLAIVWCLRAREGLSRREVGRRSATIVPAARRTFRGVDRATEPSPRILAGISGFPASSAAAFVSALRGTLNDRCDVHARALEVW
jgi:hypothetical protein